MEGRFYLSSNLIGSIFSLIVSNSSFFYALYYSNTWQVTIDIITRWSSEEGQFIFFKAMFYFIFCLELGDILCFDQHGINMWYNIFCCWITFIPNGFLSVLQYLELGFCMIVVWLIFCTTDSLDIEAMNMSTIALRKLSLLYVLDSVSIFFIVGISLWYNHIF